MRRLVLAGIAGLLTVLVGVLLIDYQATPPEDHPLPPTAPIPATTGTARAAAAADTEIQAQVDRILARPLFNASRRPAATVAAAVNGPAALPRLSAIVVSSRGRSVIFAGSAGGKAVTVAEGGRIGAYVVQSIGAGQATVTGPDGAHVLRPLFDGAATRDAAAAPVQPSILDLLRQGQTPPAPGAAPR